jgi:hypothetical protein
MTDRLTSLLALGWLAMAGCSNGESDAKFRTRFASATCSFALREVQGPEQQGQALQGCQQQGTSSAGTPVETPINHSYSGWWNRKSLKPARLVGGQLFADGGSRGGAAVEGAWIPATQNGASAWTVVRSAVQDPTYGDGSTWLYAVDIYQPATDTFSPLCATDANGVAAAIPIGATFDASGNRVESTTEFTFACTAGALAKCYRWGYRPWLTDASGSSAPFADLHWACTRMARADYCGDGRSWTRNGTTINVWDTAPSPGPFQAHGPLDPTFVFEAGWSTRGAVCLSKERWATLDPRIPQDCPDRLVAPGASTGTATICETPDQAAVFDSSTRLFNESGVNATP